MELKPDPYNNFQFRLKMDGKYVAAFNKVFGLSKDTENIKFREGDDPNIHLSPGQTMYQAINLERGVTKDVSFEQWANKVWDYHNSTTDSTKTDDVSLKDFRKNLILELFNEAGQHVLSYEIYKAWPSEFIALHDLDSLGSSLAIQSLTIQNEGWQVVDSAKPKDLPDYNLPSD